MLWEKWSRQEKKENVLQTHAQWQSSLGQIMAEKENKYTFLPKNIRKTMLPFLLLSASEADSLPSFYICTGSDHCHGQQA